MNTNTAEPVTKVPTEEEYIRNKDSAAAKHRKAQRYFPIADQIQKGDRFTVKKGTSVYCAALSSIIVLHDDIKVEIIGRSDLDEPFYVDFSFNAVKLVRNGNGDWTPDSNFGTLDVGYTNLSAWHYTSK